MVMRPHTNEYKEGYMRSCQLAFSKNERKNRVFNLKRRLYGFKDVAPARYDLPVSCFSALGFLELENAHHNLKRHNLINAIYIDELIVFGQTHSIIN